MQRCSVSSQPSDNEENSLAATKGGNPYLDCQCCAACADSTVFVRPWRAEQRHDPVTLHLDHAAFKAGNGPLDGLDRWCQTLRGLSGAQRFESNLL